MILEFPSFDYKCTLRTSNVGGQSECGDNGREELHDVGNKRVLTIAPEYLGFIYANLQTIKHVTMYFRQ
jgi:hypothetical protein